MAKVPLQTFLNNVNSIYKEQPTYQTGCNGSNGKCDCIGLVKGALERAGGSASGLSGTNYASRYTIKNFKKIKSVNDLKVGDVVIKGRPYSPTDSYPLPTKYLPGGANYNGDTTNYYHIGVVTHVNPLEITHMTSPSAKKDTSLTPGGGKGQWNYYGQLPQVSYDDEIDKVVVSLEYATVTGGTLNMRKDSDINSARVTTIPSGSKVAVIEKGAVWCKAVYNTYTGYVMTKYLKFESNSNEDKITLELSRECAKEIYEELKLSLKL